MRRITLTVTCVLLAIPAAAFGKTGIEFATPPEATDVGKDNNFNVALFREPRDPTGEPAPMNGVRPLVTFRSKSGRVVRVRGHVVRHGFSNGNVVRFPDSGPWQVEIKAGGETLPSEQFPDGIQAGGGILDSEKVLAASKPHPVSGNGAASSGGGTSLVWILLGLAAALGTMSIVAIRTGIPARVRGLLGGGA